MNFWIDQGGGALYTADSLDGERFRLSLDRIRQMTAEEQTAPACVPFFQAAAGWVLLLLDHRRMLEDGSFDRVPLSELAKRNRDLYADILPDSYGQSWANPCYAADRTGTETGQVLSALFYELRCMIPLVYEGDAGRFLTRMELLLEVYFAFVTAFEDYRSGRDGADGRKNMMVPPAAHIRDKIRQFLEDYAEEETLVRVRRNLIGGGLPETIIARMAGGIRKDSAGERPGGGQDPDKAADGKKTGPGEMPDADMPEGGPGTMEEALRRLYRYGVYISDNEREICRYLQEQDPETIAKMADTWTEGFRIGFELTGKDLSIRRRAGILYPVGFERVIERAVKNLRAMGLEAVMAGPQADLFFQHLGRGGGGIISTPANPQYSYDHREDLALFFNDVLRSRRLQALQQAYRDLEEETVLYAGPLVMETFGERPFSPVMHAESPRFSKAQQKKTARFRRDADLLYDRAVIGRERSFTIIAFPVPEITRGYEGGAIKASFDEIFRAVIDINTLDYVTYRDVQARIIDVLDTARSVYVRGRGDNRTELTVRLQTPSDPARQTIFENCVADVNIPVGEVFTTPQLAGTRGILHVTRVYLNGLLFEDLSIMFEDGRVTDYACGGFPTAAEGRKYIEENILFHHQTLPMGECAIGTNTTACAEAARLGILERLPILIAEKTGPHFAVGDTCYSHEEDNRVFNPDGKEIFAKDNEYSLLRESEPDRAYFGCHTDITIPYEEVGLLAAVRADGTQVPVIADGRFVLPGTEFLNLPLNAGAR